MNKPKIITICGSSKFVDIMAVVAWILERDEGAIAMSLHLLPRWYPNCPDDHLAEAEGVAAAMDKLHLRKIDLCDEIFVVNVGDHIGSSTLNEIKYAQELNKPIRWYTHDKISELVNKMLYAQESQPCITDETSNLS